MTKKILVFLFLLLNIHLTQGQTKVKLKKADGIYLTPCKINGIDFELYFDTGASLVSLSIEGANTLVKFGKLSAKDIIGKTQMAIANGKFVNGTIVIIKELKIGDLVLRDIETVITEAQNAPLLLGQSAISKFGEFSFDYNTETLTIRNISRQKEIPAILRISDEWKKRTSAHELAVYNKFYKNRDDIIKNMSVEVAKFKISNSGDDTQVSLSFDITNNTDQDLVYIAQFKAQTPKKIKILVTLLTKEGKTFTETVLFWGEDLPARNTNSNFSSKINIRDNKLSGVKIRVKDSDW